MKNYDLFEEAHRIEPKLTIDDWLRFEEILISRKAREGEIILSKGASSSSMYIVKTGLFKMYHLNENWREYVLNFYQRLDVIIPLLDITNNKISSVGLECITDGEILCFDIEKLDILIEEKHVLATLSLKVISMYYKKKEKRELQILALNALGRYQALQENWPQLLEDVPQHQIASYLGITPVALTRLKKTGKTSKTKKTR